MAFVSIIGKRQLILGYAREPRKGTEMETAGEKGGVVRSSHKREDEGASGRGAWTFTWRSCR